jgi:hypothetical protein
MPKLFHAWRPKVLLNVVSGDMESKNASMVGGVGNGGGTYVKLLVYTV